MLAFNVQQTPFQFGLAEGQDSRLAPPGTLVTAENVRWAKSGRIEKRYGTTALTRAGIGGTQLSAAKRLIARGNELSAIDGDNLWIYSPTTAKWRNVCPVPNLGATWTTLIDPVAGIAAIDSARSSGGYRVHAWTYGAPDEPPTNCPLFVQVTDESTGTIVLAPTKLSPNGNSGVRLIVTGTTAIVLTNNGANIVAYTVNLTTFAVSSATNLRTDAFSAIWDACAIGANFAIAYQVAGPAISLYVYDASLAQQATGTVTGETRAPLHLAIDGVSGESLYILYDVDVTGIKTVKMAIANPNTLVQTVAPFTIEALGATCSVTRLGVCRYNSLGAVVAYSNGVLTAGNSVVQTSTYSVSALGVLDATSQRVTAGVEVTCKPFVFGARCYASVCDRISNYVGVIKSGAAGLNSSIVEIEVSNKSGVSGIPHRYVAKVDALLGVYGATNAGPLPQVMQPSSTKAIVTLPFLATVPTAFANFRVGAKLVELTTGSSQPLDLWRSAVYGQEAYVAGGVLSAFDGHSLFDYGFPRPPYFIKADLSTSGGFIASSGNYLYAAHCEYRSLAGVLHRSQTTTIPAINVTDAANHSSVALGFGGYCLGSKQSLARGFGGSAVVPSILVVSRSTKAGTTYYRLTYDPQFNVLGIDQTQPSGTLTDTRNDTSIDGGGHALAVQPPIYTTGGVLEDEQPPSFTTMALFKQRLWGVDGSQRQIWFSKSFLDDYGVAPGFSASFLLQFDAPITAMATMDERLVVFAADRIWFLTGADQGPFPNGNGSDIQGPFMIPTDVGCTLPRSIVSTPDGVLFASSTGLYLLTRGLEVVWLGRPVQDQLAAYPNVTSAVLVSKRSEIRFTCNNTANTAGIVLTYNYVEKAWSSAKYTANAVYGAPFADACMWQGQWTAVTPDGFVLQESESTYLDGAAWVPMTIETAWISAAGPVGYAAVDSMFLLGASQSNHDLAISVGFDGEASYAQGPQTFLAGSPVTSIGPLEECKISIGTRRWCQGIRFKIQDATPTSPGTYPVGTGQGATFDTFGIEVGVEAGLRRIPATKKG